MTLLKAAIPADAILPALIGYHASCLASLAPSLAPACLPFPHQTPPHPCPYCIFWGIFDIFGIFGILFCSCFSLLLMLVYYSILQEYSDCVWRVMLLYSQNYRLATTAKKGFINLIPMLSSRKVTTAVPLYLIVLMPSTPHSLTLSVARTHNVVFGQ